MARKQPLSFPTFSWLAAVFVVLAVIVLVVVVGSTAGEVEIQVKPTLTHRTIEMIVPISSTSTPDLLPGVFQRKDIEQQAAVESGPGVVREQKARYVITIHNQYSQHQTFVKTTRFLHGENLYRLVEGVTVKAGTSLPAVIESDQPGGGYELVLGDKLTIPGLWQGIQSQIFGIADKEDRAGIVEVRVIDEDEIDAAEQKAVSNLGAFRESLINPGSDDLVSFRADEVAVDRPEQGESDSAVVTAKQHLELMTLSRQAISEHVRKSIEAMEQEKKALFASSEVNVEVIEWSEEGGRVRVTVPVGFYTPLKRENFDLGKFRGKSEQSILLVLQSEYGVVEAAVNYSPQVLKFILPKIGRVKLTIIEP